MSGYLERERNCETHHICPKPSDPSLLVNGDVNMYIPWNAPVEAVGRIFAFGQVESAGEVMAVRDVDEGAGNGDGDDGDGDGTTSGSNIHSK